MSNSIHLKRGLDIPISGIASLKASPVAADVIAIKPTDFKGLLPRLLVKEGDRVLAGSPVLADKNCPDILVCSPVSGTVQAVVRGEKRKLLAVVVKADEQREYVDFGVKNVESLRADEIREAILASGLWPSLIQRPYGSPEAEGHFHVFIQHRSPRCRYRFRPRKRDVRHPGRSHRSR